MTPLDYCRADATFTNEMTRHLGALPPPSWEWHAAHLDRWYWNGYTIVYLK